MLGPKNLHFNQNGPSVTMQYKGCIFETLIRSYNYGNSLNIIAFWGAVYQESVRPHTSDASGGQAPFPKGIMYYIRGKLLLSW